MKLDEFPDKGKAYADAFLAAVRLAFGLREHIENSRHHVRGDALAVIADGQEAVREGIAICSVAVVSISVG
jgi:hypothetical protein